MPHMSSGGSEDFYSTDEVKVYKDEGNKDEEKRSSENLSEDKLGLVTETEEGKNSSIPGNYTGSEKGNASGVDDDKVSGSAPGHGQPLGSMGFFIPPYAPYANGKKRESYRDGQGTVGNVTSFNQTPPYWTLPPTGENGDAPCTKDRVLKVL
ncbi:hypothetical protein ACOMHN_037649 [Nucella lapillus]